MSRIVSILCLATPCVYDTATQPVSWCPEYWSQKRSLLVYCLGYFQTDSICCYRIFRNLFTVISSTGRNYSVQILVVMGSLLKLIDCLIILFIITVHCISKPYEKEYINVIEAAILGILFLSTVAILDRDDIYVGNFISSVLLVIPFVYALVYLSIWPSKWIW